MSAEAVDQFIDDHCLLAVIRQWPLCGKVETDPRHETYPAILRLAKYGHVYLATIGGALFALCRR